MIRYESKVFRVSLKKQIHWFSIQSATGKSYLPEFMRSIGITDMKVFVIDNKEAFDNLSAIISLMRNNDIILLDRADLYLDSSNFHKLLEHKDCTILIDRKKGLPMSVRRYGSPVFIKYDGRSMELYDETGSER